MTVDKIIPCICTTHTPIPTICNDYGMPILYPHPAGSHKQYWAVACPICGRGSLLTIEEPSPYKALKEWNRIMEECYMAEGRQIEYEKDWKEDDQDAEYEKNKWLRDIPCGRFIEDMSESSKD
jgi:hypothetical protein